MDLTRRGFSLGLLAAVGCRSLDFGEESFGAIRRRFERELLDNVVLFW